NQLRALLQISAFGQGLVVVFTIFQPSPVGCVPVTRFFTLGCRGIFVLDCLPHMGEQALESLRQAIGLVHSTRRDRRQAVEQLKQFLLLYRERFVGRRGR